MSKGKSKIGFQHDEPLELNGALPSGSFDNSLMQDLTLGQTTVDPTAARLLSTLDPEFKKTLLAIEQDRRSRISDPTRDPDSPFYEPPLGGLSEREESNGKPGTVSSGKGDPGGISYGLYQMASKRDAPWQFTGKRESEDYDPLSLHTELFEGQDPGQDAFSEQWKLAAALDPGFGDAQHQFIEKTHYEPQKEKILQDTGLDVTARSHTLRDVVWSTAVQHGKSTGIIVAAVQRLLKEKQQQKPEATLDDLTDQEIIQAIYQGRTKAYSKTAPRYERESKAAGDALTQEQGGAGQDAGFYLEESSAPGSEKP